MHRATNLPFLLASNKYIQSIYEYRQPTWQSNVVREMIGLDTNDKAGEDFEETGLGEIIAIADSGIDETHPDLIGKIAGTEVFGPPGSMNDTTGHGSHVSGIISGNGISSGGLIRGIAQGAAIYFLSIGDEYGRISKSVKLADILQKAYEKKARILNLSWGSEMTVISTQDRMAIDKFVHDNPEMLVVVAAGNNGLGTKNADRRTNQKIGSVTVTGTSKNALTVGSSNKKSGMMIRNHYRKAAAGDRQKLNGLNRIL